jgi:hypothetical protein|tara:strand:- start:791 stop:1120 length:330 start_codon:yes stop_codon:yes gene_type:complete
MKSGKIKELELKNINDQNTALQKAVFDMGALEIEKAQVMQRYESALKVLEETKKELEAKYGAVNINLKTGVWEEIVKEDEAVVPEVVEDEEDCGCEEKKEDCEDCEDKE